jgi:hypothetical protein
VDGEVGTWAMFGEGKNVWTASTVYPIPAEEPWMGINLGTRGNEVTGIRIKVAGWVLDDGSWKVGLPLPFFSTSYAPIFTTRHPVSKIMRPGSDRSASSRAHAPPPLSNIPPAKSLPRAAHEAPSPPEFSLDKPRPSEHFREPVSMPYLVSPPNNICSAPRDLKLVLNAAWQENYPVSIYVGDSRDWKQNCPCVLDVMNFSHPQVSLVGNVSGSISHVVGLSDIHTAPKAETILPNSTVEFFCPTGTVGRCERHLISASSDCCF